MIILNVNGARLQAEIDADTPILWVLRDSLGMTGTKFGCGMALCGACTVHLDGAPIRSCVTPVSQAVGRRITPLNR
jgi:isoquinoline 1-oxidoreductase subunit alpha